MIVPRGDRLATLLVAVACAAGALWALDVAVPGTDGVRATTVLVLLCGFVASAWAVVPNADALLHGDRRYLAAASLLGAFALASGVLALVTERGIWLAALLAATVVLWAMSTARHVRAATWHTDARPGAPTRSGHRTRKGVTS